MRRFLREPLLHFLLLGALLFALYGWLNRGLGTSPKEVVVSRGQIDNLQAQFARTWRRAPTPAELSGLVDTWVREEILYREGIAMGLERDDTVVRRRVSQKVEFLADGLAPSVPTTAELQAWLDAHADDYRIAPTYSLRQLYFDPARHPGRLEGDISAARLALSQGKSVHGDSTMLPQELESASASEVVRVFGNDFEQALKTLPVGEWRGPVRSGFGLHLVELRARDGGRPATLDEARQAVERDLLHARTREAKAAFYDKLRAGYKVRIEGDVAPPTTDSGKPAK